MFLCYAYLSIILMRCLRHLLAKQGGFFKAHQDYLSLTSNCVEEYTLLICVTLPEAAKATQGGETRVEVSPGHDVLSRATTTPGSALLFRKVPTAEIINI